MNDTFEAFDDDDWRDRWLDLDKAWRDLQRLFTCPHPGPGEICLDLVRGNVTYPDGWQNGYLSHYDVLCPDQVANVARTISMIDKVDVLAMYVENGRVNDRLRDDVSYIGLFLERATKYVADRAEAGEGIVYRIG